MRIDLQDLKGKTDFAILTIREDEATAVLDRFKPQHYTQGQRRYEVGTLQTCDGQEYVFVMARCVKQGEGEAQRLADYLIQDLDPRLFVLVGIGGAVPSADFTLGDVVCATHVHDFCVRAAAEGGSSTFNVGGGEMHSAILSLLGSLPRILQTLPEWNTEKALGQAVPGIDVPTPRTTSKVYGSLDWRKEVCKPLKRHFPGGRAARAPTATARPVASSDALMKDTETLRTWLTDARSLAAVEMELAGVYIAARKPYKEYPILAIRGISDVVGFRRAEEWTRFACQSAASFAHALFLSGEMRDILRPSSQSSSDPGRAIPARPPPVTEGARQVCLHHLPVAGRNLFGREKELELLDEAWATPHVNVVQVVAWGGVGKSSLVGHWLTRLAGEQFPGAGRVYGWTFYSEGATDRVASADVFIESALRWFGDPAPEQGFSRSKGERLARLIKAHRALLILDGLEPLQYPPGRLEGRLKDQALQALLRELAFDNPGLCVISTRLPLSDLEGLEKRTVWRVDLDHLAPADGARLLRALGVTGDDAELTLASTEFGGHCLALTLLGSYLADAYEGDIRRRHEIGPLEEEEQYGGHARRVMAAYEKWLGEGPEVALLRVLGLFDRPASPVALAALRSAPAISGLTDTLQDLSEPEWRRVVSKLRRAMLVAEADPRQPDVLATHPLVRDHFAQQLKKRSSEAWREGNRRLYQHLAESPEAVPATLEQMDPLYAAVAHGCEAGHPDEALALYQSRIQRGEERCSFHRFGAYGADLTALSAFFRRPWRELAPGLAPTGGAFVLGQVGRCLRALGRLAEAAEAFQASMTAALALQDWKFAAGRAGNLSQVHIFTGELDRSETVAREGIELADRSGDLEQRVSRRTNLADALHHLGRLDEAEAVFGEAEVLQKEWQPGYPRLRSIEGFRYCDLLLTLARYQEVQDRVQTLLEWDASDSLLALALHHLALGLACLRQARSDGVAQAQDHLQEAVSRLRRASTQHHLPRGLLAWAEVSSALGRGDEAERTVEEALSVARRGGMALYEADCYLAHARLCILQGNEEAARKSLSQAREIIQRTGYWRRKEELEELEKK